MNLEELLEKFRAEDEGSILSDSNRDDGMPSETFGKEPEGSILPPCPQTGQEAAIDPVSLAERIGLKYEQEIPDTLSVRATHPEDTEKVLGKAVLIYRGHVLAWEKDTPATKVYAWACIHLFPGRPLSVDIDSTARLLGLTPREVRDSLARLTKDKDLLRTWERGREFYRLNVQYPEGGTNATRNPNTGPMKGSGLRFDRTGRIPETDNRQGGMT